MLIVCLNCCFGLLNIVLSLVLRTTPQSKRPTSVPLTRKKIESEKDAQFFFGKVRPWDAGKKKVPKILVISRGKRTSNSSVLGVPSTLN